jgi:hypothetical protein
VTDSHPVKQGDEPSLFSEKNMSDEIDNRQAIEERVTPEPKKQSNDTDVHVSNVPPMVLPPVNPNDGATVGTSPVLQEMNGLHPESGQVNEEVFEEIPINVCGQLYKTTLEIGFSLKNRGLPMRELPETRVKTQAEIIYGILKKNQISVKHIDIFMLGAGMMGDWRFMGTLAAEQEKENAVRGKPKENEDGKYGEIPE